MRYLRPLPTSDTERVDLYAVPGIRNGATIWRPHVRSYVRRSIERDRLTAVWLGYTQ
jgi:hypothetical protein